MVSDAQRRRLFAGRLAGYVANAGNARTPIDDGHDNLADLIDETRFQHSAVEGASPLEQELSNTQHGSDLVERDANVDVLMAKRFPLGLAT